MESLRVRYYLMVKERIYIRSCFVCKQTVAESDFLSGTAGLSRIDGNSENGYELYHTACCKYVL